MKRRNRIVSMLAAGVMLSSMAIGPVTAEGTKYVSETTADGWIKVTQDGGETLGYSPDSGVTLLEADGFAFKDLNKNGTLDVYEDWREDDETRAKDLASRISLEQGAAMMVLSFNANGTAGVFDDLMKTKIETGTRVYANNDSTDVAVSTGYVNTIQAYAEAQDFGIPIQQHCETGISNCSIWPNNLGMAATFDTQLGKTRANWYAKEFRALGITDPNLPQIDTSTDPRYTRYPETFGEDPQLVIDMGKAYVDGLQSTYDEDGNDLGWGSESVVATIKHFPGNGSGEGGRGRGALAEYDIYPGDNFDGQVAVFKEAMHTDGKTGGAVAVMPKYNIDVEEDGDALDDQNVGANFSSYIMVDLLREELGFDGVCVTDYGVTSIQPTGVEELTELERHLLLIENDVDLISLGGSRDGYDAYDITLEALKLYAEAHGNEAALTRVQRSAERTIRNMMHLGLFENPYLDTAYSKSVVNCAQVQADAMEACHKSVIMLKNATGLIQARTSKPTVYVPLTYTAGDEPTADLPSDARTLSKYFNIVTDTVGEYTGPADANGNATLSQGDIIRASAEELDKVDFALVMIANPQSDGVDDVTGEVIPKTLQYRTYTANSPIVRKTSISGDYTTVTREDTYGSQELIVRENRSYYGKSATADNEYDLDLVEEVASRCKNVVVAVKTDNPFIPAELDAVADSILLYFDNNMYHTDIGTNTNIERALYDVIAGGYEPSGLLPFQMPLDMNTVELQLEDIARDCDPYVDAQGNTYDFAYGLNWSGVIQDERVEKYAVAPLEF